MASFEISMHFLLILVAFPVVGKFEMMDLIITRIYLYRTNEV